MNGLQLSKPQQHADCDLYEDLSQFIKIFKTILNKVDILNSLLIKQQNCVSNIQQLRQFISSHLRLVEHYNFQIQQDSSHQNTCYRFVCRLSQSIITLKSQIVSNNSINSLLKSFAQRAQSAISSYNISKNIGKIFKKIFNLTQKYCLSCESLFFDGDPEKAFDIITKKQLNMGSKAQNHLLVPLNKNVYANSQTNFHRVMSGLSRRFATLGCLDVEYSCFKSVFFQARSQKQQLYEQILQRNLPILRQIAKYSKQFQNYLNRKQKSSLNRKNRFKESMGSSKVYSQTKTNNLSINSNQQNSQSQRSNHKHLLRDRSLGEDNHKKYERYNIQAEESNNQIEKRKTSYQLKNVFITLDKINVGSKISQGTQYNSNNIKIKDKLKNHTLIKMNKYSLKSTKIEYQHQPIRPILQIRQCQYKNAGFNIEQSVFMREMGYNYDDDVLIQQKQQKRKPTKYHYSKLNLIDKKSIRIAQLVSKSSTTSKVISLNSSVTQPSEPFEIRIFDA